VPRSENRIGQAEPSIETEEGSLDSLSCLAATIRGILLSTMSREEVLRQLDLDLRNAQDRRALTSDNFDSAIRGIPSGSHRPDNKETILATSKAYRDALEDVREAVKRKSDFLVHGKLPGDRKPPEPEDTASST
jgi:hypothetical protein